MVVGLAVGLVGLAPVAAGAAGEGRPNVLLILTDDQRAEGTLKVMPTLRDWLGAGGTSFARAFATTPLCCPSRASILTGQYAHNHGIRGNPKGGATLRVDRKSALPDLDAAGYRIGYFGKYLNHWPLTASPSGVDEWAIVPSSGSWYEDMNEVGAARWNVNGRAETSPEYSTTYIRERALDFMRRAEEEEGAPWLLYLAPITPHWPSWPEDQFASAPVGPLTWGRAMTEGRRDKPAHVRQRPPVRRRDMAEVRAAQLRALMSVDAMLGSLRSELAALGEENTLVVFSSDNGLLWGEHGLDWKSTPYMPAVRVPLYLRWPGHVAEGAVRDDLVALLDLAPTIAAAAGVDTGRQFDGQDLLGGDRRRQLLLEYWRVGKHFVPTWKAFLTPTFEYIEYYRSDGSLIEREAYQLDSDPHQLTNLYGDRIRQNDPRPRGRLLASLGSCEGASCP